MDDLTQAQIAKLTVEAEEIRQRMARAEKREIVADERAALALEAGRLGLEQDKVQLEVSQCEAREAEIALAKARRDEELVLTQSLYQHVYNFTAGIDLGTVSPCIERLSQWDVIDPKCEMTIIFNSPGGSVIPGMALFDFIRFMRDKGHKVTVIALGHAASMAGILLQAGDVRVMAKGSWLLIHEVAFMAFGKIGEVEDEYKFGLRLKEQAATIFVERSGGKLTRAALEKGWKRKDWWLSADEALGLGLIDEVR